MQIQDLFKNKPVYIIETSKGRVSFSLLSNEKYSSIAYIMTNYPCFKCDLEDEIWDECVIQHTFPCSRDSIDAGVVTTVSQLILLMSSPKTLDQANQKLVEKRSELSSIREQAIIAICQAFPAYFPEHLEKMTWDQLSKRLAQAEVILEREFEFKSMTSQAKDDSDRIHERLEEYTNNVIDFSGANREYYKEELGRPAGDYNLHNIRGR